MTKGQNKAKIRRRLRKRGTGGSTTMLGRLTRYNYGIGPKTKNPSNRATTAGEDAHEGYDI